MPQSKDQFERNLDRRLGWWRGQVILVESLRLLAWVLGALLLVMVYDLFVPLETHSREVVAALLLAAALVFWGCGFWRAQRIGRRELAREIDTIASDPRRTCSAAVDLQAGTNGAAWLRDEMLRRAGEQVERLPKKQTRPLRALRMAGAGVVVATAVVAAAFLLWPAPFQTAAARLLMPDADIPPYSPYQFTVIPENPEVPYGESVDLTVEISGAEIDQPVYLLTRTGGEIERADCFRAQGDHFSQRLENVTQPTEFAFATGKTRSKWHSLQILLEPRFTLAKATITPPAYTGRPASELLAGAEPLEAVQGSDITLHITSNRPLSRGHLTMPEAPAGQRRVEGTSAGLHTLRFDWPARHSGPLDLQIFDTQGTPAREPLTLHLDVQPDQKPDLSLTQPPVHSLATPSIILPLQGRAEDDHGLRRVELVRTMPGYRERGETLAEGQLGERFDIDEQLDLAQLGVRPGDVLELYLEGRDRNPSQLGIQTSPVSRVEIISEEEYASLVRRQLSLKDLSMKLGEIERHLREIDQSLETAKTRAGQPDANDAEVNQALQNAQSALQQATRRFRELAKDFPAYDYERELSEQLEGKANEFQDMADQLEQLTPGQSGLPDALARLQQQIRPSGEEFDRALESGEDFLRVAAVMEEAAKLRRLVRHQERIAQMMDRHAGPAENNASTARHLAEQEEMVREELAAMPERLRQAAEGLDGLEEMEQLQLDTRAFADALAGNEAHGHLDDAVELARAEDLPRASQAANKAAQALNALIEERNQPNAQRSACQFAGMCMGQAPGGSKQPSLAQFLKAALSRGSGQGGSGGGGSGAGGSAEDGFATEGYFDLALPVFGPLRSNYQPASSSISSTGSESDGAPDAPLRLEEDSIEAAGNQADRASERTSFSKKIPEKYRGAVRRYFEQTP